jgi:hypothetical protein
MWHEKLGEALSDLGILSSRADPDIWMRPSGDNSKYEYIAVYVDDLALAVEDPKKIIETLTNKFKFKLKAEPLSYHLDTDYHRDKDGTLVQSKEIHW